MPVITIRAYRDGSSLSRGNYEVEVRKRDHDNEVHLTLSSDGDLFSLPIPIEDFPAFVRECLILLSLVD